MKSLISERAAGSGSKPHQVRERRNEVVPVHAIQGSGVMGLGFRGSGFISHNLFLKSFGRSQFSHKFVNLFFIFVVVKDKLTDLWGN